jgi:uncharacterized protein (TIGR04255 family)
MSPQVGHDQAASGWTMRSDEGTWTVTLDPEFFSLETSAYENWPGFRGRLSDLLGAVQATYAPGFEVRIGLRYVDEIVHPDVATPTGWKGWIRDELLGPLAHSDFGNAVRAIQQIVELDAGGSYRVILRHGTSPVGGDSRWLYLLDHDCFRQAGRPLQADAVLSSADDLHRLALQVFQASISPELYSYLEGK